MTPGPQPSILVVDDEPAIRLLCRINLELEGFAVEEAGSLDDARSVLGTADIGVVLLDVHVGSDNGCDLLRELRRDRPDVRVAMLTGDSGVEDDIAAADAVIPKPFAPEAMTAQVRALLGDAR